MPAYISTSCINQDLLNVLDTYDKLGIENVELGVYTKYIPNLNQILENYDFNYIVHHYFPPPQKQFIINLASSNEIMLNKSIKQIINSINFCYEHEINYISIHSGFRVDPSINLKFNLENIPHYKKSFDIFVNSLKKIVDYAENNNVEIAVENNVLSKHNLVDGENKLLLMCEFWEFKNLFNEIGSDNLSVLLDLGHLKVNSNTLNFDMDNFIKKIQKYVSAIHLHENSGLIDDHECINSNDEVYHIFCKYFKSMDIPHVLECKFNDEKEIMNTLNLLNNEFY